MSNGIGTWFCKAGFDAGWGWDDAVECAMFLFFPVWAHRVVHLREQAGGSFAPDTYQAIPLRYSDSLVRHVIVRRWLTASIGWGVFLLFLIGFLTVLPPNAGRPAREWAAIGPFLFVSAPCLIVGGIAGQWLMRPYCRRQRDIRRVLGLHSLGTSDPARWVDEDRDRIQNAGAMFGTTTYAAAVPKLLAAQAWTGAMWAARLSAALENESSGEQLTDEVLRHPGTQEALRRFRQDAKCWPEAMGSLALRDLLAGLQRDGAAGP
jgi:hypothetical protein